MLEAFGLAPPSRPPPELGASAAAVLAACATGAASADELARATGLDAGAVAAALAELELAGLATEAARGVPSVE